MKKTLWLFAAIICGTNLLAACSSDSDDQSSQSSQPRERVIKFEGIENGRDMGGLVMQDGRTIRYDMLVRSANLFTATDADVDLLKNRYHLSDVFDFRFDAEVAACPDRVIDGVSYTRLPTMPKIFEDALAAAGSGAVSSVDTRDMAALVISKAFDPQAQKLARGLYPGIVTDAQAQRYYGDFLRGVLKAKGGVLWHCSQGKDRAGWAAAFVLAALGASRDVIVQDFDMSNQSYATQIEAASAQLRGKEGSDEAIAFIKAMVGVSRENFETTLDLIDKQYGSLTQYLENQLGFTKEEQSQLKAKYCE